MRDADCNDLTRGDASPSQNGLKTEVVLIKAVIPEPRVRTRPWASKPNRFGACVREYSNQINSTSYPMEGTGISRMRYLAFARASRALKRTFNRMNEKKAIIFVCTCCGARLLSGIHSPLHERSAKELCKLPVLELPGPPHPERLPPQPAEFRSLSVQTSTSALPGSMA
jgi:hypothetical protein